MTVGIEHRGREGMSIGRPYTDAPTGWRLLGASALVCASCSLLVDTDARQCETHEDCAAFHGTACIDNACVIPEPGTPGECRTHEDCRLREGAYWICRRRDQVCAPLRSEHCRAVFGDHQNEHAIYIGSLLQTDGEHKSTGLPAENAIRLAIEEFEQANNGLPAAPGQTARRPLVLVGCDASEAPVAAAEHLVQVVQVPAIIGASFSGTTIRVATEVTIPNRVLLISPSATSAAITQLQDDDLVWRTSPSDMLQALALQQLVPFIEMSVRAKLADGTQPIRLAIAFKGDSYGRGLADAVESGLVFNGKSAADNWNDFRRYDYGDPAVPESTSYPQKVQALLALEPHIVLLLGTTEAITDVLAPLEQGWDEAAYRPHYLLSDGGLANALWELVGADADLRRRILGTVPGTENPRFDMFRSTYNGRFTDGTSPDIFGAAGGYDATYLIGYAIAGIGTPDVTGPALLPSLARLAQGGTKVAVGFSAINTSLEAIADGGPLDFEGASGPLDFDIETGEAPSDIQVWCLPADQSGKATSAKHAGWYLDATTRQLTDPPSSFCE